MKAAEIIIADDDKTIRTVLTQALEQTGYETRATGTVAKLWEWVSTGAGDVVITDVIMPDQNAFELIPRIKKYRPDLPIIVISAQNTLSTAIEAAERGAYDYLPKPFDLNKLIELVARALDMQKAVHKDTEGEEDLPLVGRAPAMQEVFRAIARLTQNDLSVLITGESGTGKELVARALHDYGKRKNGEFIAINMAAIPKELIESELFGYEKGAFTGAVARTAGRFQQAEGGTLFLDEIGDMPMDMQTRLLRVLQEGEYSPVGGQRSLKTDVRIIAATHQDLPLMVKQGLFREDLYFRLNVVPLRLPPLRERREDVDLLVRHFVLQGVEQGLAEKSFTAEALALLQAQNWEGNVRELENFVQRLMALHTEDVITDNIIRQELGDMPEMQTQLSARRGNNIGESMALHLEQYFVAHEGELPPDGLYQRILREIEIPLINRSLEATRGNQIKAAKLLGLNRNTLRKKITELDIDVKRGD